MNAVGPLKLCWLPQRREKLGADCIKQQAVSDHHCDVPQVKLFHAANSSSYAFVDGVAFDGFEARTFYHFR